MEQRTDKEGSWPSLQLWGVALSEVYRPRFSSLYRTSKCPDVESTVFSDPPSSLTTAQMTWHSLDSFSEVLSPFSPSHTCRSTAAPPSKGQLFKELMGPRGQRWYSRSSAAYLLANMDMPVNLRLLGNSCVLSMKRSREGQEKVFLKMGHSHSLFMIPMSQTAFSSWNCTSPFLIKKCLIVLMRWPALSFISKWCLYQQ